MRSSGSFRNEFLAVAAEPHRVLPHAISSVTEEQRGLIKVVRFASQLNVLDRREAALREWLDVMEFEEGRLATPSAGADERAASLIALPDVTFHRGRDVPTSASFGRRRTKCRGRGASASFEVREQQGHCPIDKRREIARRIRMPQEILRAAKLVVRAPGDLRHTALT